MNNIPIVRKLCVAILFGLFAQIAVAEPIPLTSQERAWLDAHPVIQIAPDPDFAPIEYLDENGEYKGIAADYAALIEEKLGIQFTIAKLPNWDTVLEKAQAREVDMFGAATASPQREEYMLFTEPHIRLPGVIITRDDTSGTLTLDDIAGRRVAAVSGYIWFDLIGNDRPNFQMDSTPSLTQGLRDLSFGNLDAIISDAATATRVIRTEGLTNLRIAGDTGYETALAFGVRKDWPELGNLLNKAIATITDEERASILQRWVSLDQDLLSQETLFIIAAGAAVVLLITLGTLGWNRILSQRVAARTRQLDAAQQELLAANVDLEKRVRERTKRLQRALKQLQASQTQLVQSEKMATMGQLVAGVAHEINTPLGYVYNNVQLLTDFVGKVDEQTNACRLLTDLMASTDADDEQISSQFENVQRLTAELTDENGLGETMELVEDSNYGLRQISDLVLSLKDFSRVDRANEDGVDLHQSIEHTLKISHHVTKNTAEIVKSFGEIPKVRCNPSQINQVLLNVLTNACHAIQNGKGHGTILITTEADSDYVYVGIQDDGVGMQKDVGERIFEPFFTTKTSGSGTGLGLSISYNILKQHNAKLRLHSRPGKGTLFKFGLPIKTVDRNADDSDQVDRDNIIDLVAES
ncbi:MAG: transporter substrate-binding domain-containing protein [Pseudomonadota bacterium]